MAYTARTKAECQEFFDSPEVLSKKIKKLAALVRKSEHFVAFTGAGISTAAGIADFRSGINTVLETGAGKWAKEAAVKEGKRSQVKAAKRKTNTFKAVPTAAHMSLVSLMESKHLKHLISQNTDGLHRRSGIPLSQMSELHGNRTLEFCQKCGKEYMRDFRCRNSCRRQKSKDHFTGRFCSVPDCRGRLHDTIVNFGESLPSDCLEQALIESAHCDLMLSLGSSLTVTPAADMPRKVGRRWRIERRKLVQSGGDLSQDCKHNLVVVNLQKTPLDDLCSLRIFAKIDDVMTGLMRELNLPIPRWKLNRFIKIEMASLESRPDLRQCIVSGVDIDGTSASVLTDSKLSFRGRALLKLSHRHQARFCPDTKVFNVPVSRHADEHDDSKQDPEEEQKQGGPISAGSSASHSGSDLMLKLSFYKHYLEPTLTIALDQYLKPFLGVDGCGQIVLRLIFDLHLQQWIVPSLEHQIQDKDIGQLWLKSTPES